MLLAVKGYWGGGTREGEMERGYWGGDVQKREGRRVLLEAIMPGEQV